jgi:hypothetical protein
MRKTLPKGHTSCLSSEFTYTSATHTDLGKTFARIKQQLKGQSEGKRANICPLPKVPSDAFAPPLLNRSGLILALKSRQ